MFSLFQRKRVPSTAGPLSSSFVATSKELMRPEPAASLLSTPRRKKLLEHIWQRTSLSRAQFATLYRAPLERYAELVQQFPASESHHHAYPGGMLDHGLEVVAYAVKLRQSRLLPPGESAEVQVAQAEAWTAGTAYAALLHDIGKLAVDLHVEYANGAVWHPWHGPLDRPYRFRYRKDREYRLHSAAVGLLYTRLLDRDILDWLSSFPELWSSLLYVLAGQYEHAGTLGELVVQADQASVAQELGGDPTKALTAPKHALQRKLLDGLRYLVRKVFKLNQPQASDGWLTQDALWLVSKTVSDKLRAHLLSQGVDGIPSSNTAVFDVLQDHGIALATSDGKAIWKATVTSDTGWSHSFTLLRLAPALIWEPGERPAPFAGQVQIDAKQNTPAQPSSPTNVATDNDHPATSTAPQISSTSVTADSSVDVLLDLLALDSTSVASPPPPAPTLTVEQESARAPGSPSDSGTSSASVSAPSSEHFMAWLRQSIQTRKLIINDAKALVHTVSNTAYLVSPGVFQRYAQEHPQIGTLARQANQQDWQWMQKRFERLQLHRKQPDGLNIWTCEVTGPRKSRKLHGYLLEDPQQLFDDVPPNNPYLSLAGGWRNRRNKRLPDGV